MAMSKESQKEAAARIMAKMGPMSAEEKSTYEMLVKRPEDYRVPGETRVCGLCGQEFSDEKDSKGNVLTPALEKFSDHQAFHNPSADKWATAHERIQAGKERAKQAE